ncbi:MAG: hypothetical protein IT458_15885 [Planctomycetes bacterium]|nr:hypothetical protein [Planctomycetota bacterium]
MQTPNIGPTPGPAPAGAAGPSGAAGESTEFRRMLERLEELARQPAAPVEDAEQLGQAVRQAEQDFLSVMDLRRRLEDVYRRSVP